MEDHITLRPMTEEEFERFNHIGIEEYAQERARNFGAELEGERAEATRQWTQLLKDGLQTKGHHLWSAVKADGAVVGCLWVLVEEERRRAFIFSIRIEERERGKGFGRQTLQQLEAHLRPKGITSIGLNVFADNEVAQALYRQMGYRITNANMVKRLS